MPRTNAALAVGNALPATELTTADGGSTTIAELLDGRPAVVHFMRTSTCPACLSVGKRLASLHRNGDLGDARVIFLTPGTGADAAQAASRLDETVRVAAVGPHHGVFGLRRSGQFQESATAVVDADGTVIQVTTAAMPAKSFDRAATLDAIAQLATR
ncbi:TlpA family protein disulfide reductase [Agromyces sp. SYSU T00194]|uniref:TlpA family protein disulfide reductase n=1 Tax=Agromyces chitinivorans TaxID=3158560 RepID=UPI003393736F